MSHQAVALVINCFEEEHGYVTRHPLQYTQVDQQGKPYRLSQNLTTDIKAQDTDPGENYVSTHLPP